jgi:hypothetical protein
VELPNDELILTTFDWVPEPPRGYVRDIRVRWALEEAALHYRVESVPFRAPNAEHVSHQQIENTGAQLHCLRAKLRESRSLVGYSCAKCTACSNSGV